MRAYLAVTKPRLVILLVYVALVSGWLTSLGEPAPRYRVGLLLGVLAVTLASMGANAITCYLDRDLDRVMVRTMHRPIPQGRIRPPEKALYLGLGLALAGVAASLATGHPWSTFWLVLGLVDNILVYSLWLKRRSIWNVLAGAPSGGFTALVASSAITGRFVDPAGLLLCALVVVWTPLHIWSLALRYRDDYRRAGVPMLPAVFSVEVSSRCLAAASFLLLGFSALLISSVRVGLPFLVSAMAVQAGLLVLALAVMLRPTERRVWLLFKYSSPYLAILSTLLALGYF